MIAISDELKQAFKSTERRIKGYVEILYDVFSGNTATASFDSTYTSISDVIDNQRVENLYGSLDYLPLDGTRLTVLSGINTDAGYISNGVFEDIENPTITVSWSTSSLISGVTVYTKVNIITNATITLSNGATYTVDNDKEIMQVIFPQKQNCTGFTITINSMMYLDRKIYIDEIDAGISYVYKDRDLIEFDVEEEVNKLVEEVPTNETTVMLNNMSNLFNPLNPTGVVPYLSEYTKIIPYVGAVTETSGTQYVKCGEFYFDSYSNNSDATTTLIGKNIIKQVEQETLKDGNQTDLFAATLSPSTFRTYLNNYRYSINDYNCARNVSLIAYQNNNLIDLIKDYSFYQDVLFYGDRDNKLNFKPIDTAIKTEISKNDLLEDVSYKQIDKINTVRVVKVSTSAGDSVTSRQILNETVKLSSASEVFLFKSSSPNMSTATVTQSGGSSIQIISQGMYFAFVKITGTAGNSVTVSFTSTGNRTGNQTEYVLTNRGSEKEVSLVFESPINFYATSNNGYISSSNILSKAPSYEMTFSYIGDPSIEARDYINVETIFGYRKLFVQKHRIKFDGGLTGSIEGVE